MAVLVPRTITLRDGARVVLRSPEEADAAATLEFRRASACTSPYIATSPHEVPLDPLVQVERIRQVRERDRELLVMAVDEAPSGNTRVNGPVGGGKIVALAALTSPGRERLNHVVDLGIGLAEVWRGRGLGRAIMETLIDWARAQPGILKVALGVIPENRVAVDLYRRLGFVDDGLQRAHFRGDDGVFTDHLMMAQWVKAGEPR